MKEETKMKWFKKRKNEKNNQGEKNLLTDKIIKALNYTPVDYVHSEKFISDGQDPVDATRKKLATTNPDSLCDTMLDPSIDADTINENVFGKNQQIHHINTILQITDSAIEEGAKAPYIKELLLEDRERLIAERDKFVEIRDSL